eukprot:scaffold310_cov335-Pavlova_lutheri.AAC.58
MENSSVDHLCICKNLGLSHVYDFFNGLRATSCGVSFVCYPWQMRHVLAKSTFLGWRFEDDTLAEKVVGKMGDLLVHSPSHHERAELCADANDGTNTSAFPNL